MAKKPEQQKQKNYGRTALIVGVVFMVLFIIGSMLPSRMPGIGEEAVLSHQGSRGSLLAVNEESWEAMLTAEIANDKDGLAELMAQNRIIYEENGTRVKVIERNLGAVRVRIRNGDHPGVAAWVQTEFVVKP